MNYFKLYKNTPLTRDIGLKINNRKRRLLSTERCILHKLGRIYQPVLQPNTEKSPPASKCSEGDAGSLLTLTRMSNTIPTQVPLLSR